MGSALVVMLHQRKLVRLLILKPCGRLRQTTLRCNIHVIILPLTGWGPPQNMIRRDGGRIAIFDDARHAGHHYGLGSPRSPAA